MYNRDAICNNYCRIISFIYRTGRLRGLDRMVVGFATTRATSSYNHLTL